MWKRVDSAPAQKDHGGGNEEEMFGTGVGEKRSVLGDATNTNMARSVKRMRVKGGNEGVEGKENVGMGWLATAREKGEGTPRSECAGRVCVVWVVGAG